jgi:ubiquinone/menaquinone biosynthesis C-methylase UbiE
MFFPERISSIEPGDRVLEIGPGGAPFPRSDVLLEKVFADTGTAEEQRGYAPELKTDKTIIYYNGDLFPFKDKEFDYVICSHVLEHVEDVDQFLREIVRVGKKGYIEYPLVYYEYLYNFRVHQNLIHKNNGIIYWMNKSKTKLNDFASVQLFFYQTLNHGYVDMVDSYKDYFFEGYEWYDNVISKEVDDIAQICLDADQFKSELLKRDNKKKYGFIKKLLWWLRG